MQLAGMILARDTGNGNLRPLQRLDRCEIHMASSGGPLL